MTCPYCAEPINDGATVCKTCRRDVGLAMSLKEANRALETRVQELEAELAEHHELGATHPATAVEAPLPRQAGILDLVAIYVVLPTVALIGVHYLLVIKFDTRLIWLRAVSIALPAIFGWMLERKLHPKWFTTLAFGVVVAFASVLGMSTMVHVTDGDPILPHSAIAWRETLEYVTSIALSFLLGSLIAFAAQPVPSTGRRSTGTLARLATFIALQISNKAKGKSLDQRVERTIKLIKLAASATTAIGAIYTGFKGIL